MRSVLCSCGDEVAQTSEPLSTDTLARFAPDILVSYGYRHILRRDIVDRYTPNIYNLHISLLPWNRGSDPNFWSFFDDTPKGVTLHCIDHGVDTGTSSPRNSFFSGTETLASSYARLQEAIETLFTNAWPRLRTGALAGGPQHGTGSTHRACDKEVFMAELPLGWETPVSVVEAMGRRHRSCALGASKETCR
ncbi:MAG: formyl transferase [Defluviicoccus sp.]|nr:MAG: formyl transferase [Defluviicoccus sp.]